jgi:hypothetical protein
MQILLLAGILLQISFLVCSNLNQDDTELLVAYAKLWKAPHIGTRLAFSKLKEKFYKTNFLETMQLVYRSSQAFQCAFFDPSEWNKRSGNSDSFSLSVSDKILWYIRINLTKTFRTEEEKRDQYEALGLLFKMSKKIPTFICQRTLPSLEFLHRNVSFDPSIDYFLLSKTLQRIHRLLGPSVEPKDPSQQLFNLCSLLLIQISAIAEKECMDIFTNEAIRHFRPLVVYLILKLSDCGNSHNIFFQFMDSHSRSVSKIIEYLSGDVYGKYETILIKSNQWFGSLLLQSLGFRESSSSEKWDLWKLNGLLLLRKTIKYRTIEVK